MPGVRVGGGLGGGAWGVGEAGHRALKRAAWGLSGVRLARAWGMLAAKGNAMGESTSQAKQGRKGGRWWLTLRVVVALVLGVMTTYGVAWGVSLKPGTTAGGSSQLMATARTFSGQLTVQARGLRLDPAKPQAHRLQIRAFQSPAAEVWQAWYAEGRNHFVRGLSTLDARGVMPGWVVDVFDSQPEWFSSSMTVYAVGWPWRTHWSCTRVYGSFAELDGEGTVVLPAAVQRVLTFVTGWRPAPAVSGVELPTRLIVHNFVAASLLWGTAWFLPLSLVPGARWMVRRRKGHCVACNYSRAGLPPDAPCPECGLVDRPAAAADRSSPRAG